MNQNDKNKKLEKFGMTHNQIRELKSFLVGDMLIICQQKI